MPAASQHSSTLTLTLWKSLSRVWLFATPWTIHSPWNSPGQNSRVGRHSLLQGIFPTQGLNPRLPHCRQILYQLSHQGSPWILEWVAYPFSCRSSWPRDGTRVFCIAGGLFTNWATGKAPKLTQDASISNKWFRIPSSHSCPFTCLALLNWFVVALPTVHQGLLIFYFFCTSIYLKVLD